MLNHRLLGIAGRAHEEVADGLIRATQVQMAPATGAVVELHVDIGTELVVGAELQILVPGPAQAVALDDPTGRPSTPAHRVVKSRPSTARQAQRTFGQQRVAGIGVGTGQRQQVVAAFLKLVVATDHAGDAGLAIPGVDVGVIGQRDGAAERGLAAGGPAGVEMNGPQSPVSPGAAPRGIFQPPCPLQHQRIGKGVGFDDGQLAAVLDPHGGQVDPKV